MKVKYLFRNYVEYLTAVDPYASVVLYMCAKDYVYLKKRLLSKRKCYDDLRTETIDVIMFIVSFVHYIPKNSFFLHRKTNPF